MCELYSRQAFLGKTETGGVRVRGYRECVILICEECGEKMVLEGSEATWRSESNPFECGCGEHLTLADREGAAASEAGRLAG